MTAGTVGSDDKVDFEGELTDANLNILQFLQMKHKGPDELKF